ncbi:acyl-CoA dehydrogenase family protein [Sphingomonas naphthae]|uniref:Acyl-CoA dehydrogenase family protein n=1 Tax=Sphingomonas naphthae TaxID=1813468 RepID=A0ABY7TM42_9SPHN|nr:acyl-CoA dehydrogenase family protein [Sphingomonas naphthae]WCT73465.1 acyl-CoA dehydrogenase family protein [Sphingomonas naphthae]
MTFHPDADQRALIEDAFSRPLDELLPLARLHAAEAAEPWEAIAGLGIFGVAADPDIGGVGLGPVEEALVAMELGRRLAGAQILTTLMAYHCADEALRARLVTGEARVAPATLTGGSLCVIDGDGADHVLLRRDGRASLVPIGALADRKTVDDHHWTATLADAGQAPAGLVWADDVALTRVRLIEAAALSGMAACATTMAVDYAKLREQFGHAIGGFQAVKHQCANMAMAAMAARDQTSFASVALEQGRADAAFQVESALLLAIDAALANSRRNVQVHGGIGFSEEADPHLVVKRAHLLIEAAGGADAAADRVAGAEAAMIRQG